MARLFSLFIRLHRRPRALPVNVMPKADAPLAQMRKSFCFGEMFAERQSLWQNRRRITPTSVAKLSKRISPYLIPRNFFEISGTLSLKSLKRFLRASWGKYRYHGLCPWGSIILLLLVFGSVSLFGADSRSVDKRDVTVDSAIGGMAEGSRIVSPDEYGKKTEIPKVPDTRLSPLDTSTKVSTGAQAGGTMQGVMSGAGQEGVSAGGQTSVTIGGTGEGNIDTSGGIGGGTTAVEEQPIGSIEGPGETGGGGITEPEPVVGTTPETGGSLIDIDANVGIDNGGLQTDVNVGLDTEQRDQILDADVGAGAGEAGGVTGGTDITARDISPDSELPPEITESAISSGTDIGTEVDTSGSSVGNEADIGVEADVEGGGEGDDLANDPADGLPGL